nr:MAG TPA: intron associated endonuclease [Caudoviricetes sp.]
MYVYKITNNLNGMIYIGKTIRDVKSRIAEHKYKRTLIGLAIRKFGIKNFTVEIVEECKNSKHLKEREIFWIKHCDCIFPKGYNKAIGDSKFREFNGFYNKHHDINTIRSNQYNQANRKRIFCVETATVYESLRECEKALGMSRTQISRIAKGLVKNTRKYHFKFID